MKTIIDFSEIGYWEQMNSDLSITPRPFSTKSTELDIDSDDTKRRAEQMVEEGYFVAPPPLVFEDKVNRIAAAIETIVSHNLPPVFIFVYDEIWQIFTGISKIVEPVLDTDYKITIAGMWAWRIGQDETGFTMHRDVYARDTQEDGRPTHLTVWIPFTDATPLNSCIYVLPTNLDPNYPDNLLRKEIKEFSHVRAVPAKAGSIMAWNANIAHWGSKSSHWTDRPRISVAMDFSRDDADVDSENLAEYASGPYLDFSTSAELSFEQRLNAIGEALSFYKNRVIQYYPASAEAVLEFCKSHKITSKQKPEAQPDLKPEQQNQEKTVEKINTTLVPARKCVVKDCDGQGFGVYATKKIAANEIIEACHTLPVPPEMIEDFPVAFPLESFDYRLPSGQVEQVIAFGLASVFRHSTTCNAAWRQHETVMAFEFYALNDIEAGEEIRINYFRGKSTAIELVPPTKLEVRKSPGKGLGVFAIEDIVEGEVLEDCRVMPLGNALSAGNAFDDYRFNYPKGVGSKKRVLVLGLGCVFNHAENNNAYWINHPTVDQVFRFLARRDIARGEEVCTYYGGQNYWKDQGLEKVQLV